MIVDVNLGLRFFWQCHTTYHGPAILITFNYNLHGPLNVVVDVGFSVFFPEICFLKNISPLKEQVLKPFLKAW